MHQDIPRLTAAQRELSRRRLVRRARVLVDEISRSLRGGEMIVDARERQTGDVEASVTAASAQRDGDELAAIEGSLARIESGDYGLCAECGEHIPWTRLDAFPAALRCMHCEEAREKRVPAPATL
jgi:DnaK suppressor protein